MATWRDYVSASAAGADDSRQSCQSSHLTHHRLMSRWLSIHVDIHVTAQASNLRQHMQTVSSWLRDTWPEMLRGQTQPLWFSFAATLVRGRIRSSAASTWQYLVVCLSDVAKSICIDDHCCPSTGHLSHQVSANPAVSTILHQSTIMCASLTGSHSHVKLCYSNVAVKQTKM